MNGQTRMATGNGKTAVKPMNYVYRDLFVHEIIFIMKNFDSINLVQLMSMSSTKLSPRNMCNTVRSGGGVVDKLP
jgi:hypothetical protein